MTTRAQNTINAPTCVPETRFCCLKICGWDSGQPFVKSPGSSNTRPPCTYMKGKFPTPVNGLSGKFPGVSRGGMVTPGIDSCITVKKSKKNLPNLKYQLKNKYPPQGKIFTQNDDIQLSHISFTTSVTHSQSKGRWLRNSLE